MASAGVVGGFEEDAIVLVGMQGLLAAPLAAEAQPAERHAGVAAFGYGQLDHPAYRVVVEQRDDLGDLGRGGAVSEHALYQLTDLAAHLHQRIKAWRVADGPRQVYQVDPLQRKQITLGNHATQPLVIHQADVGDVPFGHRHGGIEGAGLGPR